MHFKIKGELNKDAEFLDSDDDTKSKKRKKKKSKKQKKIKVAEEYFPKSLIENKDYLNPFDYGYDIDDDDIKKRRPYNYRRLPTMKFTESPRNLDIEKVFPGIASRTWSCMICYADLTTKELLVKHYEGHKKDGANVNKSIELLNDPASLIIQYFCHICNAKFDEKEQLRIHSEVHNNENEYPYRCNICEESKSFTRPYDFSIHSYEFHKYAPLISCPNCEYKTIHKNLLNAHQQSHEKHPYKYICEICNKGFFRGNLFEGHKNIHKPKPFLKPFECDLCHKKFAAKNNLIIHKNTAHPETIPNNPPIYQCKECHLTFPHDKSLTAHMKVHTGEGFGLCDFCGKVLSSTEKLTMHRRIHTGEKPFKCDSCGKPFRTKMLLKEHFRTHSGEKPYKCEVCDKGFSQRSPLTIHRRTHTGERPYVCGMCGKGFTCKGLLGMHSKHCKPGILCH